jgi:hypothetical protein
MPDELSRSRFQACVAGWSTSKTRRFPYVWRYANVSSPAPSTTTWHTPRRTAAASASSANRLRAAMNTRMARRVASARSSSGGTPRIRTASGSVKIDPSSSTWCAAR